MKLLCRATALVLCLALALIAVSGCGGKKKSPSKKPSAASSAKSPAPLPTTSAPKPKQPAAAPGPESLIPGLEQPPIPGLEPVIPGLQPASPGRQPAAPGKLPTTRPVITGRPAPKDLLRAIRVRYATLESMRLRGVSTMSVSYDGKIAGKSENQKFTLAFRRPDRFDYSMPETRMVSNGRTVYTYFTEAKRYVKAEASGQELRGMVNSRAGVGIWGLLLGVDYEAAISSMKLLKDTKVRGKDVFVLSLKLKPGVGCPPGSDAVQKLYISKSDLVLWRNELTMTSHPKPPKGYKGKVPKVMKSVSVGEMTSFEANPKLADSAFRFTPPPGTKPFEKPKLVDISDKPAPDFSFALADGAQKKISDLRGRVIVLDFWALPPAQEHLPVLQKIWERYKDQVEFVTVNLNEKGDKVDEYMRGKGLTFPTVHGTMEIGGIAAEGYGVRALPTVFIIDSAGVVRRVIPGNVTEADLAAKIEKIKGT